MCKCKKNFRPKFYKLYLADNGFLCCLHLLVGCIAIGVLGLLVSILGFVFVIVELFPHVSASLAVISLMLVIVYFSSKCMLLIGCCLWWPCLMVSFIFEAIVIFAAIIMLICVMAMNMAAPLAIGLAVLFIMVDIYFAWVVISYWNLCTRCCGTSY